MEEFEIREVKPEDVAMLVRLFNESRDAWPGGFRGVDATEESISEMLRNFKWLKYYVAASSERIIGECVLQEGRREEGVSYIGPLFVHQDFHGKKFGKRLLLACVNAGMEMGYRRIDLHTWTANMKAVPLYKKSGFFWVPDTTVYMQNFLPTVFADPIAKRYFAKHDWYQTLKRQLELVEDKWEIGGRKVFVYEWEAEGDRLKAVIDRESGGICEITDGDLLLAMEAEQEPVIGMEHKVRWRLRKCSKGSVPVTLMARGEEGVKLEMRRAFRLERRKELEASFNVDPEIKPKDDETAYKLQTQVVIAGEVSELSTGLRPKQAAAVYTEPREVGLAPGQCAEARICVRSNLKKRAMGKLQLAADQGLELRCAALSFELPAEGRAGVPVRLTPKEAGAFKIRARAELSSGGKRLRSKMEDLYVTAVEPGKVVCYEREDMACVETEMLRIRVFPRGARLSFHDKLANAQVGTLPTPLIGPPFYPSALWNKKFELRTSCDGRGCTVELSADSERFPGVRITRRVVVGAGPLIKVEHLVTNRGEEARELAVSFGCWTGMREAKVSVPTAKGLISEYVGADDYPSWEEYPKKPEEMKETWVAHEGEGIVLGLVWRECERVSVRGPELEISFGKVAPGATASHAPVYLYAGPGDWRAVRGVWQRYVEKPAGKPTKPPEPREVRSVEVRPEPIVVLGRRGKARISVTALTNLPRDGGLELAAPKGWSVKPAKVELKEIKASNPCEREITFSAQKKQAANAGILKARWRMQIEEREFALPFICAGAKGKGVSIRREQVEGRQAYAVDNGRLKLRVSPDFMGSLFALEEGGVNHLFSAFPEAGSFMTQKPWYGGIHPVLQGEGFPKGQMDKERFRGEIVKGEGELGWAGVRVVTNISRPGVKGIGFALEYLTLPESNIVAMRTEIRNRGTADFWNRGLLMFHPQVGGERGKAVLHYEMGRVRTRRRSDVPLWLDVKDWAAVGNPERGKYMAFINASEDSWITIHDMGKEGVHPRQVADIHVPPKGKTTFICYVVLTDAPEKVELYASLKKRREL